jgi:hypothetical protein
VKSSLVQFGSAFYQEFSGPSTTEVLELLIWGLFGMAATFLVLVPGDGSLEASIWLLQ